MNGIRQDAIEDMKALIETEKSPSILFDFRVQKTKKLTKSSVNLSELDAHKLTDLSSSNVSKAVPHQLFSLVELNACGFH